MYIEAYRTHAYAILGSVVHTLYIVSCIYTVHTLSHYIIVEDTLHIYTYAYHDEAAYDLLGVALDRKGGAVLAYPLPDLVIPVALVT